MIEFLIILLTTAVVIFYVNAKSFTHKTLDKILYNDEIEYESQDSISTDSDEPNDETFRNDKSNSLEDNIESGELSDEFSYEDASAISETIMKEILGND